MKQILMVVFLGLFAVTLNASTQTSAAISNEGSPRPLKVLTFNFNSEIVPVDPQYALRDRRFDAIKKWVHDNDPDIIFFQEAWSYKHDHSVAQTLARAIGYDVSSHLELGFFRMFFEAIATLTKKNLNLSDRFALKLPHSAPEAGDGKTWVIELGEVSYAVGGRVLINGTPTFVYSVHFLGTTPAQRKDQAQAVISDAQSRAQKEGLSWDNAHVIVGGDFNSIPTEPAPQAFITAGFIDTFQSMHPAEPGCTLCEVPDGPNYAPFGIAAGQVPSQASDNSVTRIDYLFSHGPGLKPVASTLTFTSTRNGVWMSDHYGITTTFSDAGASIPNPVEDNAIPLQPATVVKVTPRMLQKALALTGFPALNVYGSRGIAFENNSGYPFEISVSAKPNNAGIIYAGNQVLLFSGQRASFTFSSPGEYGFKIIGFESFPKLRAFNIHGDINVLSIEN